MVNCGVLIAAMSLDFGGAETHVIDLATRLSGLGFRVNVASQGGRLVKRLEQAGVPHLIAPLHSRAPLSLLAATRILGEIVEVRGVDLFHAHGRIPAWVLTQVQRSHPTVPLVTTYHGVYTAGFPWNLFTRQGDVCIAVSDDIKSHLLNHLGFDGARVEIIPNGIDTRRFSPAPYPPLREELVAGDLGPVVTNVSRLDAQFAETAISLVESLPSLDAQHPGVVGLVVGDGDRLGDVQQACERCNNLLRRRAAIAAGGQEDVVPYLLSSDVVVAVARSALEAMACGKPVVLAGEGGFRGALSAHNVEMARRHNFTARGSSVATTAGEIGAAVNSLLESSELRAAASALGLEVVTRDYSWEALVPRTLAVYEKAFEMKGLGRGRL